MVRIYWMVNIGDQYWIRIYWKIKIDKQQFICIPRHKNRWTDAVELKGNSF